MFHIHIAKLGNNNLFIGKKLQQQHESKVLQKKAYCNI